MTTHCLLRPSRGVDGGGFCCLSEREKVSSRIKDGDGMRGIRQGEEVAAAGIENSFLHGVD